MHRCEPLLAIFSICVCGGRGGSEGKEGGVGAPAGVCWSVFLFVYACVRVDD